MVLGMPNWSYTYYTLTGDAVQLKELYGIMSELGNADTPNDPRWLGYLVEWLTAIMTSSCAAVSGAIWN